MARKAASVFVQTLKNHGVNRFFCVPGESYLSVMDELLYFVSSRNPLSYPIQTGPSTTKTLIREVLRYKTPIISVWF